jgi:acetolactate synthase-1/2/3 large subunit
MKKTGAQLAVFALEQVGVKYTFGIPGTHTTELYDALDLSKQITPILVNHEGSGAFMADALSRTSDSIGTLVIVPAAGLTHAMSGIGEAFLDGIPMLVIAGGTRTDTGRKYQLHQFDQVGLAKNITKAQFSIETHEDIIPSIYEAYRIATSGEPGPVFIELPVNLQLFEGEVREMPVFAQSSETILPDLAKIRQAVEMLKNAKKPMFFVGWGAVDASQVTVELAEMLAAPVATTLQGKSAFPNTHPLYTSVGVGKSAKPSSQWALKEHDMMLAIGTRFAEIATGSYGLDPPKNLVHIDINPEVFDQNFKTTIAIEGDAVVVLKSILTMLKEEDFKTNRSIDSVTAKIEEKNDQYFAEWLKGKKDDIVSPGYFFKALKQQLDNDVQMVIDDGKHTFLASELFPVDLPRHFISPTDFNCMGYCVPAAIAVKLANPQQQVAAIVGDGAFMMTGVEMTTAVNYNLPVMFFVFNDGELGQISQFQKVPLKTKTCSVLGDINFEGLAAGTGVAYVKIDNDNEIENQIAKAIDFSKSGQPVLVEVKIDYSKKTMMTKGVIKVNLKRFPFKEKIRFIARSVKRHTIG